jgi:transposase-like protein
MGRYSEAFKARMVQRMTVPGGPNAERLSDDINVPAWTLRRWLNAAAMVGGVGRKKPPVPPGEDESPSSVGGGRDSRSSREWSPAEKLRVVAGASQLKDDDLGAFLRREGLHLAQLEEWRADILSALGSPPPRRRRLRPGGYESWNESCAEGQGARRGDSALGARKKVQALFGTSVEEGDSMDGKNEKK